MKLSEGSAIDFGRIHEEKQKIDMANFPFFPVDNPLFASGGQLVCVQFDAPFFLDQTAVDLDVRAILLEKQVITHLLPLDPPSVDSVCKAMGRQSATRFTVILPSGRVIGDSRETPDLMDNHANRPEIATALSGEKGTSIRYSNTLLQSMIYVARPIKENANILAVIRASIPTTFIERELKSIQLKIGLGGLLIALLAAGISLLISRRITNPIVAMKKSAGQFAEGDFSQHLTAPDSEEMAGLA